MYRTRRILAAALTGLAFAAAGCGDNENDNPGKTNTEDSVVDDDATGGQVPGQTAPGPGDDDPPSTTRTDGE